MKENVVIYISGLHSSLEEGDCVEMVYAGKYYFRGGKHFIKYSEVLNDGSTSDNMIKISKEEVDYLKKGEMSAQMVFSLGKKNLDYYETPFGAMTLGVETRELIICESENEINVSIEYELEMNGQYVSDSTVAIRVVG